MAPPSTPLSSGPDQRDLPSADERRLLGRAGFGVTAEALAELRTLGWEKYVERQLKPVDADDAIVIERLARTRLPIEYGEENGHPAVKERRPLRWLDAPVDRLWKLRQDDKIPGAERERPLYEVRAATALRAVYSRWQLRELLVDFWHNHFNTYPWEDENLRGMFPAYDRDAIRAHALGNFREMLEATATSPVMLVYLNNFSSKASPANENYARELFELHSLGAEAYLNHLYNRWREVPGATEGRPAGYIDQDVYEAARAFTGWTIANGEEDNHGVKFPDHGGFHYAAAWHDPYQKRVLGTELDANQPPLSDGKRVLDLVATHPATARHLSVKLCRRLLSDDPSAGLVERVAAAWSAAAGAPDQIAQAVRVILLSTEFRTGAETKVKRPLELAASFLRATGAEFRPSNEFFVRLEACGQPLFGWVPPSGFPDQSAYWLTSRYMIERWNLLWDLARGELDAGRIELLRPAVAAGAESPKAILRYWAVRLLGQPVSEAVEKALLARAFPDVGADDGVDPFADETHTSATQVVALLAMTPSFQNR